MIAAAARLARSPRARPALAVGGGAALLLLSAAPGGLAPAAARAGLVAAIIAAAAALARRRAPERAAAPLRLVARQPLAREAGVALLEVEGRRILVGYGPQGVRPLDGAASGEVRS